MPRKLPWLNEAGPSAPRARVSASSSSARANKRRKLLSREHGHDGLWADEPELPMTSSPPPAPDGPPDEQQDMREGYEADDMWMMVEDEFMATAQLYTQHLHHAEYVRLQREAKEREANYPSPGRAPMAGFVAYHKPTKSRQVPRPSAVAEDESSGDSDIADPKLASLMDSPRKVPMLLRRSTNSQAVTEQPQTPSRSRTLMTVVEAAVDASSDSASIHSPTRSTPAAIFDDEDTDDDLDVPVKAYIEATKPVAAGKQTLAKPMRHTESPKAPVYIGRPRQKADENPTARRAEHIDQRSLTTLPQFGESEGRKIVDSKSLAEILARRRNKARAKTSGKITSDTTAHNETTTEIPTFMF